MSSSNIFLFADQPWQIDLACRVSAKIHAKSSNYKCSVVVSDFYCFVHEPGYLDYLRDLYGIDIIDFLEVYRAWQTKSQTHEHGNFIDESEWIREYGEMRTFDEVERSNQLIFGFEREFYYFPIKACCKKMVFSDMESAVKSLIVENSPVAIVSIERQTLPINLANVVAKSRSIPWFSILPTRLGDRWILSDEFGMGMTSEKFEEIIHQEYSSETLESVDRFISDIREKFVGAYITWVGGKSYPSGNFSRSELHKLSKYKTIFRWLLGFIKQLLSRFYHHPRVMLFQPVFLDNSPIKLTIFEMRSILVRIRHLLRPSKLFNKQAPTSPFIFWALHVRPEGSSNVLSLGMDEIQMVRKFASQIPDNFYLVVKENPIMFGQRSLNFYKALSRIRNVYLVDPYVSSIEFMSLSSGVAGISGTALLEAEILGKPSLSLGRPEFEKFLGFNGWLELSDFLRVASNESYQPSQNLKLYLAHLIQNSEDSDIPEFGELDSEGASKMIARISQSIIDYL